MIDVDVFLWEFPTQSVPLAQTIVENAFSTIFVAIACAFHLSKFLELCIFGTNKSFSKDSNENFAHVDTF